MPIPRLYVDQALHAGLVLALPPGQARHVQVLRLQAGDTLVLFDGRGGEWQARIEHIGRRDVQVAMLGFADVSREATVRVTLAAAMPANDRFDWLIEKATELGAAAIQPLTCERSVVRLDAQRAQRKLEHWRGVAIAAAEQCGGTCVPQIEAAQPLEAWLRRTAAARSGPLLVLSPSAPHPLGGEAAAAARRSGFATLVSGPEGGLSPAEIEAVMVSGGMAVHLGPRILRAETAPLAALTVLVAGT